MGQQNALNEDGAELTIIARRLVQIAYSKGSCSSSPVNHGELSDCVLLGLARIEYKSRRLRDKAFPKKMFGEAAWDILLIAFISFLEGRATSITSLTMGSANPPTTALRYINVLEEEGFLRRRDHPHDRRSSHIGLTAFGLRSMRSYFSQVSQHDQDRSLSNT